jgi:hypothetical protein
MHDQETRYSSRAPATGGAHEADDVGSRAAVAADTAKETAKDEARTVASTAKQEAGAVVGEAKSQVRRLTSQARDQATERVRGQHSKAVDRLRSLADEFQELGGEGDSPGRALVSDLGQRGRRVADYLDDRGPEGLVSDVTDFARRRPMAFLAGAVAAGFLVGRLGKNMWKAQSESGSGSSTSASTPDRFAAAPGPVSTPRVVPEAPVTPAVPPVTTGVPPVATATPPMAPGVPPVVPATPPVAPTAPPPSVYVTDGYEGESR